MPDPLQFPRHPGHPPQRTLLASHHSLAVVPKVSVHEGDVAEANVRIRRLRNF